MAGPAAATTQPPDPSGPAALQSLNLRAVAVWLKRSGRDGYLAAEVADTLGLPRRPFEEVLEAKQRGFRTDEVLRIAQAGLDEGREFVLFMVQRPDGEVHFFLSSVREGLKKAVVSIPSRGVVVPMAPAEAASTFQQEIRYWTERSKD